MNETTEEKQAPEKFPCSGCAFSYTVSVKGLIRKHNSRTGPGLCDGAQKPPLHPPTDAAALARDRGRGVVPDPFTAPGNASVEVVDGRGPWITATYDGECDGTCGVSVSSGDEIRADGMGGWLCSDCGADSDDDPVTYVEAAPAQVLEYADGSPVTPEEAGLPTSQEEYDRREAAMAGLTVCLGCPDAQGRTDHSSCITQPDPFTAPAPVSDIPDGSVSQQPEPDRDRWGRYVVQGTAHTRATTFAKSCSDTFSLSQWGDRMVVRGLTLRPDLLALAHGLDVKQNRKDLNSIAEQAKEAAGQKVAANLGSAYHAFSERLDAGLMKLEEVPEAYRGRLAEYLSAMSGAGLTTRPEWIERTTAVRADQVGEPVAGTLDRIVQLPNGELVIADLKTGSDLSYGWGEIAVQLALYAHGVNTHGLFDWRTKTWESHTARVAGDVSLKVRTDYAIVMHLPADKEGCTLYRVDIEAGWEYARLCGHVRAFRKNKQLARPLELTDIAAPVPSLVMPFESAVMQQAMTMFNAANSREEMELLYEYARDSEQFTDAELWDLSDVGQRRLGSLGV